MADGDDSGGPLSAAEQALVFDAEIEVQDGLNGLHGVFLSLQLSRGNERRCMGLGRNVEGLERPGIQRN